MDKGIDQLQAVLVKAKALPVLFVGSGLSQRLLGIPDWEGLLEVFATEVEKDIGYYRAKNGNDLPKIATDIAHDFYDHWWKSEKYSEIRNQYRSIIQNEHDPLKIEVCKYIEQFSAKGDPLISEEIRLLRTSHVHSVITTNWDRFLEDSLDGFEGIVGQSKMLTSPSQAIGEIYKIHGSVSDPLSIILTDSDYNVYWERNPYLVAKIVTLFIEHPILFFGYSLRDTHIRRVLANIASCLDPDQIGRINDRLIFVGRINPKRPAGLREILLQPNAGSLIVQEIGVPDLVDLFTMLGNLPQHYPVKILRKLRESVYDLAYWGRPNKSIQVIPFDNNVDLEKIEVVIGMGAIERLAVMGYRQFTRRELFLDMLRGKAVHAADVLTDQLMIAHFKGAQYAPLFYPLSLASRLDKDRHIIDPIALPKRARKLVGGEILKPAESRQTEARRRERFADVLEENEKSAIYYGPICKFTVEDVLVLRAFLTRKMTEAEHLLTELAKLGCLYDRLVFGDGWTGDYSELRSAVDADTTIEDYLSALAAAELAGS
jgi:hypothetical protein